MLLDIENKYNKLLIEHNKLQHEFSENVIIQSMQDMKETNEELSNRLDKLNVIIDKTFEYNKSAKLMLNVLSKNIDSSSKHILKCRIEFIEDILGDSEKLKSEACYINYT